MSKIPFKRFGLMLDMSRNAVTNLPSLKKFVDLVSDMGYNTLFLYIEDTYEIPGEPYFGHQRGRYSQDEIRQIVAYCETKGMEVIPCIQTLAHLECMLKWRHYFPIRDTDKILQCDNEEVYDLIRKMLQSIKDTFKSKSVHIGMDEAHMMGLGKYLDKHGYKPRFEILRHHLQVVCDMAKEMGLEPNIWGDMFFRLSNEGKYFLRNPKLELDKIGELPENLGISAWYYYSASRRLYRDMIRAHKALGRETWFAGGIWTWKGVAPDNRFSVHITRAYMDICIEEKIDTFFLTMWENPCADCSRFSVLPALYTCARMAQGEKSMKKIQAEFEEKYKIPYNHFLDLDMAAKKKMTLNSRCVSNEEMYLLFNDPFMGLMDGTLMGDETARYKRYATKLARYAKDERYGLLFAAQSKLSRTLSYKADLTARTRKAYLAGDKEEIQKILHDYDLTLRYLRQYMDLFCQWWHQENKPQGYEVHDQRLGGLCQRLLTCKKRLQLWLEDGTPIPELEEPVLDFRGKGEIERPGHFFQSRMFGVTSAGRNWEV